MDKADISDAGTLAAFSKLVTSTVSGEGASHGRGDGFNRASDDKKSSHEGSPAPESRRDRGNEGTVERDGASVMRYIASLHDRKDRFKELETALWENVAVLVPDFMSMATWTETLQKLRSSNAEARDGGGDEDPTQAIRDFLTGDIEYGS